MRVSNYGCEHLWGCKGTAGWYPLVREPRGVFWNEDGYSSTVIHRNISHTGTGTQPLLEVGFQICEHRDPLGDLCEKPGVSAKNPYA